MWTQLSAVWDRTESVSPLSLTVFSQSPRCRGQRSYICTALSQYNSLKGHVLVRVVFALSSKIAFILANSYQIANMYKADQEAQMRMTVVNYHDTAPFKE